MNRSGVEQHQHPTFRWTGFRARLLLLIAPLGCVLAGYVLLMVPAPPALIRRVATSRPGWVLDEIDQSSLSGRDQTIARLAARYLEFGSAAYVKKRAIGGEWASDDVSRIMSVLTYLRSRVLNGAQVHHEWHEWPALLRGYGYCDQLNATACEVLVGAFPRAQLVGLVDRNTGKSPHTVGRVWSPERDEWLYFDLYLADAVVYRKAAGGKAEILARGDHDPTRESLPDSIYDLDAFVLSRYRGTYAAHLTLKATQQMADRLIGVYGSVPSPPPAFEAPPPAPPRPRYNVTALERRYLAARLEHLFGDPVRAAVLYRDVATAAANARDPQSMEIAAAARLLRQRIFAREAPTAAATGSR